MSKAELPPATTELVTDRLAEIKAKRAEREARENGEDPLARIAAVVKDWVYVAGINRMCNLREPQKKWPTENFDRKFAELYPKGSLSSALLKQEGTLRKFDELAYKPGAAEVLDDGKTCNLYRPSDIVPAEGDTAWWDAHLEYLFPDDEQRNHLLNWMAWFVQNPDKKPKHALLVAGRETGTGKSFLGDVLTRIIGKHNTTEVKQSDLSGDFNGFAGRTKLIRIEELRALDKRAVSGALHDMITQDRISVNEKGLAKTEMENVFGLYATTNDDAAIQIDPADRRYLVLRTKAKPKDRDYYKMLFVDKLEDDAAMAAVAYALKTRDLKGYTAAGRAPVTSAKTAMIKAGEPALVVYIREHLIDMFPFNGARIAEYYEISALFKQYRETHKQLGDDQLQRVLRSHFGAVSLGDKFRVRYLDGYDNKVKQTTLWAFAPAFPDGVVPTGLTKELAIEMREQDRQRLHTAEVVQTFNADDAKVEVEETSWNDLREIDLDDPLHMPRTRTIN
jgi:hypothetical protein